MVASTSRIVEMVLFLWFHSTANLPTVCSIVSMFMGSKRFTVTLNQSFLSWSLIQNHLSGLNCPLDSRCDIYTDKLVHIHQLVWLYNYKFTKIINLTQNWQSMETILLFRVLKLASHARHYGNMTGFILIISCYGLVHCCMVQVSNDIHFAPRCYDMQIHVDTAI